MDWQREVEELHDFFEGYFQGSEASLGRLEAVLAPEFTIVSPDGTESNRAAIVAAISQRHDNGSDLEITTTDHRLIAQTDELVVASYVEHHSSQDGKSQRASTVTFRVDRDAPHGVIWLHVHETWQGNRTS